MIFVAVTLATVVLGVAVWSIQRFLPRFGLFVLGFLGLPLWILIAALIPGFGKLLWIGLSAYLLFVGFAVFHYRRLRRAEFLQLLATAAQSQLPIEEVLSQSLRDRSSHPLRQMLAGVLHAIVPPFWFRSGRYDEQLRRLVYYLEMGFPPGMALACVPGLATQETELAVFVGESTGKLAPSLAFAQRSQRSLGPVMLENVPRILYLGFLLIDWIAISIFVLIFIAPKYEKIFADFKIRLPPATETMLAFGRGMSRHGPFLVLVAIAFFGLLGALFCSSTVRWYTPVVRGIVRPWMQSRFLAMLGALMEAQRSVPKSLDVLRQVPFFAGTVARRIAVGAADGKQDQQTAADRQAPDQAVVGGFVSWSRLAADRTLIVIPCFLPPCDRSRPIARGTDCGIGFRGSPSNRKRMLAVFAFDPLPLQVVAERMRGAAVGTSGGQHGGLEEKGGFAWRTDVASGKRRPQQSDLIQCLYFSSSFFARQVFASRT
ncbi:MAG: hypothetical protein U0744_18980 [Gemmataceae bacterium]